MLSVIIYPMLLMHWADTGMLILGLGLKAKFLGLGLGILWPWH